METKVRFLSHFSCIRFVHCRSRMWAAACLFLCESNASFLFIFYLVQSRRFVACWLTLEYELNASHTVVCWSKFVHDLSRTTLKFSPGVLHTRVHNSTSLVQPIFYVFIKRRVQRGNYGTNRSFLLWSWWLTFFFAFFIFHVNLRVPVAWKGHDAAFKVSIQYPLHQQKPPFSFFFFVCLFEELPSCCLMRVQFRNWKALKKPWIIF